MSLRPDSIDADSLRAPVQEIFSSTQGEGVFVGRRQVFFRFAHCHLKCVYCDTPMHTPTGECYVEVSPGQGPSRTLENPLTVEAAEESIAHLLTQAKHHSVSFTGGEPLLYHRFLAALMPRVRALCPTYLETSGTQPEFLDAVLPHTDVVAMDIKLPSSTGEAARFEEHAAFYRLAKSRPGVFVFCKLVFNQRTTAEELDAVFDIVTDRETPLILQPETSLDTRTVGVDSRQMLALETHLQRQFSDVRIIPQTHKMLNVL